MELAAAIVGDDHFTRGTGVAVVTDVDDGAVQANPCRLAGAIEESILHLRGAHVLHRRAGDRVGNEPANQEPRERRVPVREVYGAATVRPLTSVLRTGQVLEHTLRRRLQGEAVKSRLPHFPREQRRSRIGTDAEIPFAETHEEPQRLLVHLDDVQQVVLVAHSGEPILLLRRRKPRQVVGLLVQPQHVFLRLCRQRRSREEVGRVAGARRAAAATLSAVFTDDQPVGAPGLLVEEMCVGQTERSVERAISGVRRS